MEVKVSRVGCSQTKGHWMCYSTFSNISFMVFLTRLLSKCLWRNHPFQFKFQKPVLRCSMLQKIKMPNFAILKWRPFEYKVKSRKLGPFLECFFRKKKFEFWIFPESDISVFISHFSWNDIYGSAILEITGHRTWQQNWKKTFDCKLINRPRYGPGQLPPTNS